MSQNSVPSQTIIIKELPPAAVINENDEQMETIEVNELPVGTIFHFESESQDDVSSVITGDMIDASGTQYISVGNIIDASHVEVESASAGETYLYNQETGEIQLIELNDPTSIDSDEVEIVTVDGNNIFAHFQPASDIQSFHGSSNNAHPASSPKAIPSSSGSRKPPKLSTPENLTPLASRMKSAPALLRNSRRLAGPADQSPDKNVPASETSGSRGKTGKGNKSLKSDSSKSAPRKPKPKTVPKSGSGDSHQIILLSDGSNAVQITQALGSSRNAENSELEVPSAFLIYQNAGGEQTIELFPESYISQPDGSVIYQLENDNETIYLNSVDASNAGNVPVVKNKRQRKNSVKKPVKKEADIPPKKVNKGGGASELKCLEQGCSTTAYNVADLRKHLTNCHDMSFDFERKEFPSDLAFKEWRQHYERDRMVSFIYRGGTKKISKDQSVTYMVCHRSGHYKSTLEDSSKRQRKMKPQGSCKIGGYCTAGIKLLKDVESGVIQADICHTHYGHPLDSEAIPHLRVNPVLKRLIVKKFEEGMNFAGMLAYIHHNPDGLEGLRVVDRRAIRNIYDSWKKVPASNAEADLASKSPEKTISKKLSTSPDDFTASSCAQSNNSERCCQNKVKPDNMGFLEPNSNSESNEEPDQNLQELVNESSHCIPAKKIPPGLCAVNLTNPDPYDNEDDIDEDPPLQIYINSVKSLRPDDRKLARKRSKPPTGKSGDKRLKYEVNKPPNVPGEKASKADSLATSKSQQQLKLESEPARTLRSNMMPNKIDSKSKKGVVNITHFTSVGTLQVNSVPSDKEDTDEEYFDSLQIHISPELEATIDKLHNHGESGPSILLYKRIGETNTKYGGFCRAFKEDDFCLIIQTPVQRQIFQLFPKIVSLEILDSPKPNEHGLKLAYLSVLDDFREAIPIAWMIADSVCTRYLNQFFRMLRYHCGELAAHYIMAPKNADILKAWTTHFSHKPKMLLSELSIKRELRILLNRHFPNDDVRASAWNIVENLMSEKYPQNLKIHRSSLEKISRKSATGGVYFRKMEKDWLTRISEWSFAHRVGTTANLLFAADCFIKLRKFVSFIGTKKLNQSIDHILKIGYDKCFLRTKRMFKGDQKLSNVLEELEKFHKLAVISLKDFSVQELPDRHAWKVSSEIGGTVEEEVFNLQSPCECKIRCKICSICMHEYMCTCQDFLTRQTMCAHIHKVHCVRSGIPLEEEHQHEATISSGMETEESGEKITMEEMSFAGKLEFSTRGVFAGSASTADVGENENDMEDYNITEVLGFLGEQGNGQELTKIVSITDAGTQKVIYSSGSSTSPLTIFQLDGDLVD